jgi:hypothetical protein
MSSSSILTRSNDFSDRPRRIKSSNFCFKLGRVLERLTRRELEICYDCQFLRGNTLEVSVSPEEEKGISFEGTIAQKRRRILFGLAVKSSWLSSVAIAKNSEAELASVTAGRHAFGVAALTPNSPAT